jgi:hypothetical protein
MYLPYADRSSKLRYHTSWAQPLRAFSACHVNTHTPVFSELCSRAHFLHFQTLLTYVHFYNIHFFVSHSQSHTAANVLSGRASTLNWRPVYKGGTLRGKRRPLRGAWSLHTQAAGHANHAMLSMVTCSYMLVSCYKLGCFYSSCRLYLHKDCCLPF